MRVFGLWCFLFVFLSACDLSKNDAPSEGIWLAELSVQDKQVLPFNFKLVKTENGKFVAQIYNADEVIDVEDITLKNDSIVIKTPVFEGYIAGTFTATSMEGKFIKESLDRIVPFKAVFGKEERFATKEAPKVDVSGIWETEFDSNTADAYMGKGIFTQNDGLVTGTFRTTTGDYRFLEGVMDGDSLKLSAFDGAHAFLFTAKVTDSSLNGIYYSGNHYQVPFMAKRNETYELPHVDSLTYLKQGYDKLAFSFPDATGVMVSLADQGFANKVVVVQLMGTWCPNCMDETKFLVNYLKEHPHQNLEVVALAFEYAKTKEGAFRGIARLKKAFGVDYPVLLAQYATSNKSKAAEKLPMLNHVLSYPTTIFIDKKGVVRKIHTGFNGPATGPKYDVFKKEFEAFVSLLEKE